jgi:putative cell wall-binding protein
MGKKKSIFLLTVLIFLFIPNMLFADNTRIYGTDRIETALAVCDVGWPITIGTSAGAGSVILAPADQRNLVDALAAAPLAAQKNAPILLTYKDSLDQRVFNRIVNLGASTVYVIGAISDPVYNTISKMSGVNAVRLKGINRYETATKINNELLNPVGTIVVGYDSMADALSASSYAAANRYAIVLADNQGKVSYGQKLYGASTIIVGNTGQVSDIFGALRISGDNPFVRNQILLEKLHFNYDKIYIANGNDNHLVDALVIAPLAAKDSAPILLADTNSIQAAGVANAVINSATQVIVVGGTSAVSESVRSLIRFTAPDLRVEKVTSLNLNSLTVRFSEKVDKDTATNPKNYLIDGSDLSAGKYAGSNLVLQDDQQTVMILLYAVNPSSQNFNFEVKGNTIYNYNKSNKALYYKNTIYMGDNAAPTISSIYFSGDNILSVRFSETVKIPTVDQCENWLLDYVDLKSRDIEAVEGPNATNGYDYVVNLRFEGSIKNGLGKGAHIIRIKAGTVSDAARNTVEEDDVQFTL